MSKLDGQAGLKTGEIYAYGMGEFGYSFFMSIVASYMMYFMTNVLLMPVKGAGILYSALQWVEAITAILAGIYIDSHARKSGRYRPWVLIGAVICAAGCVLFFTNFHFGTGMTFVWFGLFYSVSYFGYNLMYVAYRALTGTIGKNSRQRVQLTIAGTQLSTAASLLFGWGGVLLLGAFAKPETGYTVSAAIYGLIMIGAMAAVYRVAKPYDRISAEEAEKQTVTAPKDMLAALLPIIPYAISYVLSIGASTLLFTMLAYYFNDVRQQPMLMSTLYTVMTVARLASTFIVDPLAKRFEKRHIFMGACGIAAIFMVLSYLARDNTVLFFLFMGLYFFSKVPAGAMFIPCVSDCTDYNEYIRGIKARSFLYSAASTLSYIAQFVGAAVASAGLVAIHFVSGTALTAETAAGIPMVAFLATGAMELLAVLPMIFYKVDRKVMEEVERRKNDREAD